MLYRHHLQGCNQFNPLEKNDAMIDVFLKDLKCYRTVNRVKDPLDFSRECQGYRQLKEILCPSKLQVLHELTALILVKMGVFLNKIKKDVILKSIVDFVNKLILEEYAAILMRCGCDLYLTGQFCITDSYLSIRITSYCCNVCNDIF